MEADEQLTENFLSCSICTEMYKDPSTLSCGHTFCSGCLGKHTKMRQDAIQDKSIQCPNCRHLTVVPNPINPLEDWPKQFKPSFLLQELLDLSITTEDTNENFCFSCMKSGTKTKAKSLCHFCDVILCDRCAKTHIAMPQMSDHQISDLRKEGQVTRRQKIICEEHKSAVEFYCKDCKKAVCQNCCFVCNKKSHSVVPIEMMVTHMKELVFKKKEWITARSHALKANHSMHQSHIENMGQTKDSLISEIQLASQEAVAVIRDMEKTLIDELEAVVEKEVGHLRSEAKSGQMDQQMHQQYLEFIDRALKSESQADMFNMYKVCQSGTTTAETKNDLMVKSSRSRVTFSNTLNPCKMRKDVQLGTLDVSRGNFQVSIYMPALCNTVDIKTTEDKARPDPDDCTVLVIDGIDVLVVTDYINESIKTFYMERLEQRQSTLQLRDKPHSVTVLKDTQMVISYSIEEKFTIVEATPTLYDVREFRTKKDYKCLTALSQQRLAAGSSHPPCIDIINLYGSVLSSAAMDLIHIPRFMCITKEGHILVTDAGSKSVYSLTTEGKVVFQYTPDGDRALQWPRGIAVTESGNILVADNHTNKIIQLTETGEFVRDIMTQDDIASPHGICVHENRLYVTQVESTVKVFYLL